MRLHGDEVRLSDGRHVTMRPLEPEDTAALIAAVERADPWDLRRRFMGTPPPPYVLARQIARADGIHDLALGAFAPDGRLVGVAQFDRVDDEPSAEVAIEIAHDWQHDGLGVAMLTTLAELARARGIREFTASYYADNLGIRRLLHDIGCDVKSSIDHGTGYARIDLDTAIAMRDEGARTPGRRYAACEFGTTSRPETCVNRIATS